MTEPGSRLQSLRGSHETVSDTDRSFRRRRRVCRGRRRRDGGARRPQGPGAGQLDGRGSSRSCPCGEPLARGPDPRGGLPARRSRCRRHHGHPDATAAGDLLRWTAGAACAGARLRLRDRPQGRHRHERPRGAGGDGSSYRVLGRRDVSGLGRRRRSVHGYRGGPRRRTPRGASPARPDRRPHGGGR